MRDLLAAAGYIADDELASALFLADALERPLLLEGEAGVGKTAAATALAAALKTELIRLQCYEGLDAQAALYEWNYQKQLLSIRMREAGEGGGEPLFSEANLIERPLLRAIRQPQKPVLLIDEIDRADEEFEAYLLEVLSEHQITIPEMGVVRARAKPLAILTSNATRPLSDALRRRCLYCFIEYPDLEKETAVARARCPHAEPELIAQAVAFVQALRKEDLEKKPGLAETLDWIGALCRLDIRRLDDDDKIDRLRLTLPCIFKTAADRRAFAPRAFSRPRGEGE